MGAYDLILHATQSEQIRDLEDRIKKLEEQTEILYEWVQYFKKKEEVNDQSNSGTCQSS